MTGVRGSASLVNAEGFNLYRIVTTFAVSFSFYMILAGSITIFNIVTAVLTGLIVALTLSNVMLQSDESSHLTTKTFRFIVYVPLILKEIIRANFKTAFTILSPNMPIDPRMIEYRPQVKSNSALTLLANSITLTPGTLTAKMSKDTFHIHTLDADSREGLRSGSIERGVQYVFGQQSDSGGRGEQKRI